MNPPTPETDPSVLTLHVSAPADVWARESLEHTEHGWHGFDGNCRTCFNRYATLTNAFDAGYQHGIDEAMQFTNSGIGVVGGIPIVGTVPKAAGQP